MLTLLKIVDVLLIVLAIVKRLLKSVLGQSNNLIEPK